MSNDDFYKKLRIKIRDWLKNDEGKNNKFAEYLMFAPDLFHLLCKLSIDKDVLAVEKAKLVGAIAYFVTPVDLIPEVLSGPLGYVDYMKGHYVSLNKNDRTKMLTGENYRKLLAYLNPISYRLTMDDKLVCNKIFHNYINRE